MANGETDVMRRILLNLRTALPHATLFRNNVGARKLGDGSYLKYGVGGAGGSDLIGFISITVSPGMVGRRLAVFAAVEVKAIASGRVSPEQEHFIGFVAESGGLAGVARSLEDVQDILAI